MTFRSGRCAGRVKSASMNRAEQGADDSSDQIGDVEKTERALRFGGELQWRTWRAGSTTHAGAPEVSVSAGKRQRRKDRKRFT
jgi:hypothetical protein